MLSLIVSLVLFVLCIALLFYLYQGPAYVPTHKRTVDQMVSQAQILPGMRVADLGSGDGRIVIAMAKQGAVATGFEINPVLVWYSNFKIRRLHLQDKASISSVSFWNQNLGQFDVITVFGISHVMDRLGKKLAIELKPEAIVISNAFRIPELQEVKRIGSLLIYKK